MTARDAWDVWWALLPNLQFINKWANIMTIVCTIGIVITSSLTWWTGAKIADRMEAQLKKTEKSLSPRTLSVAQQLAMIPKLTAFKGQRAPIGVFPVTNEAVALGTQIRDTLKSAGWDTEINQAMAEGPLSVLVRGVLVRATTDARSIAAASVLVEALRAANIEAFQDQGLPFATAEARPDDPTTYMVFIIVGEKPD